MCDRGSLGFVATSIIFAGFFVGSLVVSPISDKYGRKIPLFVCGFLCSLFHFVSAFVQHFWLFALFRCIVGFMIGKSLFVFFFQNSQYRWVDNFQCRLLLPIRMSCSLTIGEASNHMHPWTVHSSCLYKLTGKRFQALLTSSSCNISKSTFIHGKPFFFSSRPWAHSEAKWGCSWFYCWKLNGYFWYHFVPFLTGAYSIPIFVLGTEFSGIRHRSTVGGLAFTGYFILTMVLGGIAYNIRNWRHLTMVTGAPGMVYAACYL